MTTIPPIQAQLLAQPRPIAYVSFTAEIVPKTIEVLLAQMADLVNKGFREIHLLLSTPGGSVSHGIAAYNVLRGLPITLVTHNVGNVDSIGTVIFLAGQRRYACPEATFMLHGVACGVQVQSQFFEKNLQERLASVKADQDRIAAIYLTRAGITLDDSERFFLGETNLSAAVAVTRGIVNELREVSIPAGSPVLQLVFNR
jgi:ATP-dependent Clp protease, protease subunit